MLCGSTMPKSMVAIPYSPWQGLSTTWLVGMSLSARVSHSYHIYWGQVIMMNNMPGISSLQERWKMKDGKAVYLMGFQRCNHDV